MKKYIVTLAAPILACVVVVSISGCGDALAQASSDPGQAQQLLATVLNAWKAGEAHDAPSRRSPSVRVADEDWLAKFALLDFTLGDLPQARALGTCVHWPVTLSLRDPQGKVTKQQVIYLVNAGPDASVIRQD